MDQLAIFNMAISKAGGRDILSSISADNVQAEQCRLWYQPTLDFVFEKAYWARIRETQALALLAENNFADAWTSADPPLPWRYAYAAPIGLITPHQLWQREDETKKAFVVGNLGVSRAIFSDAKDAILDYTRTNNDPASWDAHLIMAVVHALAANIGPSLSAKASTIGQLLGIAESFINQAREATANKDNVPTGQELGDILASRNYYEFDGRNDPRRLR